MSKQTLLYIFLHFTFILNAQNNTGKIQGTILDEKQIAIEGVKVSITAANETTSPRVAYSNKQGVFVFDNLPLSNYVLKTTYIGYIDLSNEISLNEATPQLTLPTILLKMDSKKLEEVTIVSKVNPIERKADKTIVNVDAFIANAGSSVLEALSRAPGVSVDQNGLIKLLGKSGVMVYIDDKPTYLEGTELESYLKSMPASNLKQIEIMTNPPAKYDAAGNAGIINLRTKRNKMAGINGNYSLNYGQGRYPRSNNSFALNYNTKKINFFSNFNFSLQNTFQDLNINRNTRNATTNNVETFFKQNSYIRREGNSQDLRLGLDYYATENTTFGITTKGFINPSTSQVDNKSKLFDQNQALTQEVFADNNTKGTFKNGAISLNMRHQIDSLGRNITIDADYLAYENKSVQVFKNNVFNPSGVNTYSDILDGDIPLFINIFALKSDYTHPLKNKANLSAGIKSSYTKTDNSSQYFTTIGDVKNPNYALSNSFLYDEMINAVYVNYDKSFDRLSMQFGLRVENTISKGNQLGNVEVSASRFNRDYTNFFPTVYFSYKLDSIAKHQINFSYGRRIDRPFYKDLNPFISPLDQFTIYSGNPFLLPTFSNNFSIGHVFKSNYATTINYSASRDDINETLEIVDGIYYSRPGNIGRSTSLSLSINGNFQIKKWWSLNANTEVGRNTYTSRLYDTDLDASGNYFVFRGSNNFTINKTTSAELGGEYTSRFVLAQIVAGDVGFINIGFRKKILQQKGSLKINLSDALYTRQFRGIINNLRLTDANFNSSLETRILSLTFSYQFGKNDNKRQKYNGKGSESEQSRVKV
jgi:hypothetical protein